MLIRTALRRSQAQIRHIDPIRRSGAPEPVARVYRQLERDFGMLAPPVTLHSPAAGPLAACWLVLREALLATGLVSRATKEAVATAVSLGNACPYCVEVHSTTLHGLASGPDAAAVAAGRPEAIADQDIRRIALWASESGTRGGFRERPFPVEQTPELIGVAVTFQYINRMVNVFLGESPLPPGLPAPAHHGAVRLLGRFMRPFARRAMEPGLSLDLLPAAPLPEDLFWTATNPIIAQAFARGAAAVEAAGQRSVPASVRELVHARLADWDGQPPGLSRGWVDDAVSGLPADAQPAGRLALLVAMASYQVGQPDIDAFRRLQPADRTLVELTAWSSLAAAREVGCWMATAHEESGSR